MTEIQRPVQYQITWIEKVVALVLVGLVALVILLLVVANGLQNNVDNLETDVISARNETFANRAVGCQILANRNEQLPPYCFVPEVRRLIQPAGT